MCAPLSFGVGRHRQVTTQEEETLIADDIQHRLEADFGSVDAQLLRVELGQFIELFRDRFGSDPSEHVVRCIVHLAGGKKDSFSHYVKAALDDSRDVIYWAEYDPNDQRIRDFDLPFNNISTSISYPQWVAVAALELLQKHDLDEIESSLAEQGCPPALATKLTLLIPSAFAAVHFEPTGIGFPKHFLIGEVGHHKEMLYANEPIYVHAQLLAKRWQSEGRSTLIERVLDWSAEAKGIKEAQTQGLTPSKISAVHHGSEW